MSMFLSVLPHTACTKICWGEEAVAAADNTKDVRAAREALEKLNLVDGSITAAFE